MYRDVLSWNLVLAIECENIGLPSSLFHNCIGCTINWGAFLNKYNFLTIKDRDVVFAYSCRGDVEII